MIAPSTAIVLGYLTTQPYCTMTNAEIGAAVCRSGRTVARALAELWRLDMVDVQRFRPLAPGDPARIIFVRHDRLRSAQATEVMPV